MYPVTGSPPSVEISLCLNSRHRGVGCIRCLATCPTSAIRLPVGRPQIEQWSCVACGACVQSCPTGALESSGRTPEAALLRALADRPSGVLGVACVQAPSDTTLPIEVLGRSSRCLAALSISDQLTLTLAGDDVWLDDTHCSSCAIGAAVQPIHRTAGAANAFLASTETGVRICLGSSTTDHTSRPPEVIDSKRLSRRALFSAVKRSVADAGDVDMMIDGDAGAKLVHRIPRRRRALWHTLARFKARRPVDVTGLPFADVLVDVEACSACGLCATFCPTDALIFHSTDDSFTLSFRPSTCLDCGICLVACPDGAVSYGSDLPPGSLFSQVRWLVAEGTMAPCRVCGTATALLTEPEPLCSVCRDSAGVVRPLFDGAGLLDDLFGQSQK